MNTGYQFKLINPVDRFPNFVAPVGLTGVETIVADDIWAKTDQPVSGAEEWNNELHWDTLGEFLADTEACE